MIPGACPDCGGARPLADYLADADARTALVAALACPSELARVIIPYLSLHAPAGRRVQMRKLARVITDLTALISAGTVSRHGDTRPAPLALWQEAIERVLAVRDAGTLELPLDGHGYLIKVAHGLATKGATRPGAGAPGSHPSHQPADLAALAPARRPAPAGPDQPPRTAPLPARHLLERALSGRLGAEFSDADRAAAHRALASPAALPDPPDSA